MSEITLPHFDLMAIANEVALGNMDALSAKIFLKNLELQIENAKESIDEAALAEAQRYGEKTFEKEGYRVEVVDFIAPRYQYAETGHPKWLKYSKEEKDAADNRKSIEKQLVAMKEPMTIADEDSGEMVEVFPPSKVGKSGIKLTKLNK